MGHITKKDLDQLMKYADYIDEIVLHNVQFNISLALIQNFVKAKMIHMKGGKDLPELPLRNPEMVLPNLVKLKIFAWKGHIKFSEYLMFFKACPNLKVFNALFKHIDGYDESYFIQKISEGSIIA